jgi:Vilmaviridae nuclease
VPEVLSGTRTSHRWAARPGSWDTVNMRAVYPSANGRGIPDLPAASLVPERLVPYTDRSRVPREGDAVHYFLDDYRFEAVWTKPERVIPRLQRVGVSLTPDFSLWRDMPPAVQLWQVYRSRWCGCWLAEHGVQVIPTVTWAGPESYEFAFAGIARGSVVAVSTVGVLRDPEALQLFEQGYQAVLAAVQPSAVLCYGKMPPELVNSRLPVHEYPARRNG